MKTRAETHRKTTAIVKYEAAETHRESTAIVKYEAARKALAAARTVDEVKDWRDKAEALRTYARQAGDIDMQNWAAEIRIRAERRAGQMLAQIDKNTGARGIGKKVQSPAVTALPTLQELGVTKGQSSKWQAIAKTNDETFERVLRNIAGNGEELTTASLLRAISPPKEKSTLAVFVELKKKLTPLLPTGADGQLRLADLLEDAVASLDTANERDIQECILLLQTISKHFAESAQRMENGVRVARVA